MSKLSPKVNPLESKDVIALVVDAFSALVKLKNNSKFAPRTY
jgi:hypothetical protein